VKLTGLTGTGLTAGSFQPIAVQTGGSVNLFTQGGIPVTGDFAAGDNVPVTLSFDNGDSIDVGAVVVKQCHEYADVQTVPGKGKNQSQSQSGSTSTAEPYDCEYPTAPAIGESEGH
jgi:hypothetical protein